MKTSPVTTARSLPGALVTFEIFGRSGVKGGELTQRHVLHTDPADSDLTGANHTEADLTGANLNADDGVHLV